MRWTIACEKCRSSKVKCKHNGQAPCIACQKSGNEQTCALSRPNGRHKAPTLKTRTLKRKHPHRDEGVDEDGRERAISATPQTGDGVAQLFNKTPRDHFTKAIAVFQTQFPEFGFLHPNDLDCQSDLGTVEKLRLLALLAVSNRYMDESTIVLGRQCASLVTSELQKRITSTPGLHLIQTFLIISLYNWGEGEGFSAWMHAGIASRMAQGSLSMNPSVTGRRPLFEIEKRTIWTCFVMDKLLSCGKRRQEIFNLEAMDVPLPITDAEFVFGPEATPNASISRPTYPPQMLYGTGDYFLVILRGLHIWSKIHTWTVSGGRKQPGMTEPGQCPWRATSDWHHMKQELLEWRDSQSPHLKYPETKAVVHVHLRQAERFGYINLIYYVSLTFLGREYIPFAPVGETKPRGPIERPLLKDVGPDTFWAQNVDDVYQAATQISNILRDLRSAGCPIHTPFTGVCAFTSALVSLYAAAFPAFMGFTADEVKKAEMQAQESWSDLERIGKVWKISEEWISVLDTAQTLFSRVTSSRGRTVRKSRYDYPELEDSINLAPLKGMPINVAPVQSHPEEERSGQEDEPESQSEVVNSDAPASTFEGVLAEEEVMDEESWRLWSFWDDPHLLSTFGEYDQ
ncbi:Fc.00g095760.m01.CDS01 [Cosmosporella sp. VM-42]